MSKYEDYDDASKYYDRLRQIVGTSLIREAVARQGGDRLEVLDAGCGTGNYLGVLGSLERVAKVVGLEICSGMRARASKKAEAFGNVEVVAGSVTDLPFPDRSFDIVCANQVLHHLDEKPPPFTNMTKALRQIHRVLRPGGTVLVNFTSPEQFESFWYYELFKEKWDSFAQDHFAAQGWYVGALGDAGFEEAAFHRVTETFFPEEMYLDTSGPLREEWRRADSGWAVLSKKDTDAALQKLRNLEATGALAALLEEKERLRQGVGLSTTVIARKPGLKRKSREGEEGA